MALYQKQLFGTDGFVILTEGKVPGHLTRLDDKGAFPREYARLFVSAPDLLEALEGLLPDFTGGLDPYESAPVQRARAALAKARGQS